MWKVSNIKDFFKPFINVDTKSISTGELILRTVGEGKYRCALISKTIKVIIYCPFVRSWLIIYVYWKPKSRYLSQPIKRSGKSEVLVPYTDGLLTTSIVHVFVSGL